MKGCATQIRVVGEAGMRISTTISNFGFGSCSSKDKAFPSGLLQSINLLPSPVQLDGPGEGPSVLLA